MDRFLRWWLPMLGGCFALAGRAAGQQLDEPDHFILRRAAHYDGPRSTEKPGQAAAARLQAIRQAKAMPRQPGEPVFGWTSIGPHPTVILGGDQSAGPPVASGRVTSIAVDPRNVDIAYLGAAMGGVWKTTDAGRTWIPLTDREVSLAIGSLAIDPSNSEVIYAATGEENFSPDSYHGVGILKSQDAGATWKLIGSAAFGGPFGGAQIGALAVNPKDGRILMAAVNGIDDEPGRRSGIYRSTDAGVTWTLVLKGAPGSSIVFNPADPKIVYAGLGGRSHAPANGIYKSVDGGLTWKAAINGIATGADRRIGRVNLTLSAAHPDVLYAAIANSAASGPLGIYKTVNGGGDWSLVEGQPGYCASTCWYANSIQVSPVNPDFAFVGGLTLLVTHNGGKTWVSVSEGANGNSIHWDIHALVFSSGGGRLFIGADGGIYRGDELNAVRPRDIGWNNLNDTLGLTQFYQGCSAHPREVDLIVCGTQDNGTQIYTGSGIWRMINGGDGGFTALDTARRSVFYITSAGTLGVAKSSPFTTFKGFVSITSGLENLDVTDCFVPPLALDPANPQRLYFGCRRLFQTSDGGGSWEDAAGTDFEPLTYIAVAPSHSGRIYAASQSGLVYVTDNATGGRGSVSTWVARSQGLPQRPISSLAVDQANPGIAYATALGFSGAPGGLPGHVFRTADAGLHWQDISGNLPNIPVNILTLDTLSPGRIFVGSDVGVFQTVNGGKSWAPVGDGLPRTAVVDLKLQSGGQLLRAATHGRGMWELKMTTRLTLLLPNVESAAVAPRETFVGPQQLTAIVKGSLFDPKAVIRWNGADRPTEFIDNRTLRAILAREDLSAGRQVVSVRYPGGVSNAVNLESEIEPEIKGIANGAGPTALVGGQPLLAPGSIVSIYGTNLAPDTSALPPSSTSQALADATVEFRNTSLHRSYLAKLLYVSPSQINFQVPHDVGADAELGLTVVQGAKRSQTLNLKMARFSPGVFTLDATGAGQGWVICVSDGKIAGAPSANSRPARRGELVRILATGLGPYWHVKPTSTIAEPKVSIAGLAANVTKSEAQDRFDGIYEVTVELPSGAPSGLVKLSVTAAGGARSNEVTIAVE
jgi:uncharacterized protein (TIGR03437 family)